MLSLTWTSGPSSGSLPDGPVFLSLRPEHVRLGEPGSVPTAGSVRVRGKVLHQAFHGATELIRVECSDGLVLVVRTASGTSTERGELELESSAGDAVAVRESPERN